MCIKNTEKSFIKLQKRRIKFFFFLVVSNLTYGKNISDNEHQLIFSIPYSVFSIRIVESEQYYSYSVYFQKMNYSEFIIFSKNKYIWYSVFGPYSLFFATLGRSVLICFPKYNGDAMQCINHLRRHNMLYFSLELFTICSYHSRLAFKSTKANLAFSLMYLFILLQLLPIISLSLFP